MHDLGSPCVIETISVAFALPPPFCCASRPVIPASVLFLLCCAPHPLLAFPTALYPVGFEGKIHDIRRPNHLTPRVSRASVV